MEEKDKICFGIARIYDAVRDGSEEYLVKQLGCQDGEFDDTDDCNDEYIKKRDI